MPWRVRLSEGLAVTSCAANWAGFAPERSDGKDDQRVRRFTVHNRVWKSLGKTLRVPVPIWTAMMLGMDTARLTAAST